MMNTRDETRGGRQIFSYYNSDCFSSLHTNPSELMIASYDSLSHILSVIDSSFQSLDECLGSLFLIQDCVCEETVHKGREG